MTLQETLEKFNDTLQKLYFILDLIEAVLPELRKEDDDTDNCNSRA